MNTTSITPSIGVTIGRLTRLYYLYITTAPAGVDAPSTVTICTAPLVDLASTNNTCWLRPIPPSSD